MFNEFNEFNSIDSQTQPFKRQPHKIVKNTQTIRRLLPSVFDHFVKLALKELKINCAAIKNTR